MGRDGDDFIEQADDEASKWAAMFAVWIEQDKAKENNRRTTAQILDMITGKSAAIDLVKRLENDAETRGEFEPIDLTPAMMRHHAVADAPIDLGGGNELSMQQKLGKGLGTLIGQRFGDHVLRKVKSKGIQMYELTPAE